jgi:hypothetical protein
MSLIIDFTSDYKRGSISLDPVIFELYSFHVGNPSDAKNNIKLFAADLLRKREKKLSEKTRHFVLSQICRPSLVKSVFKTDGTLQIGLSI